MNAFKNPQCPPVWEALSHYHTHDYHTHPFKTGEGRVFSSQISLYLTEGDQLCQDTVAAPGTENPVLFCHTSSVGEPAFTMLHGHGGERPSLRAACCPVRTTGCGTNAWQLGQQKKGTTVSSWVGCRPLWSVSRDCECRRDCVAKWMAHCGSPVHLLFKSSVCS